MTLPLLTERECDLLRLIYEGRSNRDIAECLGVGAQTVKNSCGALYRKFGIVAGRQGGDGRRRLARRALADICDQHRLFGYQRHRVGVAVSKVWLHSKPKETL